MASVTLNPILNQLRGKFGDMVFRQVRGRLVVSRAPDFSHYKPSARQRAQRQRFKAAVRAAKATLTDPRRRAAYAAEAAAKSRSLWGVAISDYFRSAARKRK